MIDDADLEAKDLAGGDGDVEPPAIHPERGADAGQPSGSALVTKTAGALLVPWVEDLAPGLSKTFPDTGEFLAFARAEIEQLVLSCPLRGEEL